jgi:hypothetical protein
VNCQWIQRAARLGLGVAACFLISCEQVDTGTGTTDNEDYTMTLKVTDRFVHVGDETPITVSLRRTDNSNLPKGALGSILITTSVQGRVDVASLDVVVDDETTAELMRNLVFTARSPGIAEVRASFQDASALVKIQISKLP